MPMKRSPSRSSCGCGSIISLCLAIFFLYGNIHTSNPKCSIQDFYLPALNNSLNSTDNATLYFQLKLRNPNILKGIYYDPVNVTVFNKFNTTTHIRNYVVPDFYQGFRKTAEKDGSVNFNEGAVSRAAFDNRTAVFRVDLVTAVRFKSFVWKTKSKRHQIMVGADVEVNDQGTKVNQKNVKLSQAPLSLRFCCVVAVLFNFLVFILLNF
ncbi:hypothetical protein Patl1_04316 [Pistacia atlantica]|uniref:Uncharacterized protein n=1 Tax=Pistacia atlantica TaxID=434234 RepID=A0ACC1BWS8_9ROSI|nr:hypothetical protein Patl1_04316 [Pistacia atlantica]